MEKKYSLTFPQQNIWLVNRLYNNSKVNLITGIININKGFDVDYCKEAINNIIKNNDAMRINIVLDDKIPYQVVEEYQYENIDIVDMQNCSKNDIDKYIKEYKKQDIDILSKKLFEFKILKYEDNKGAVLLKMHHIISDAWSYSKIIEQFVKYYTSLENNEAIGDLDVPGYIEFVNTTLEYKNSEKYKKDEEFWNEYLSEFEDKVTLKDRIKNINNTSSRYNVKLKKEINGKILEYCKENRISPYVMFLAALSVYLYRIKDKNDFVIGTPSLNRANFKEKQMLGMFVSTLPLRVKIQENEKFLDVAHDIARNTMSIFRHQKYPYINTLKNIRSKNNNNNNLYGIILSYQNARVEFEDKEKYDTKWYENDFQNEDLQIHILDMDSTGILEINYDYLNELFDKIEIEYLHTRIMAIIENAILDKEIDVENIEIMSKEEKYKILYEFNDTKTDYPKDKSVIELFEEQVEKTPDNIALVFEDKKITYKELNERANSVAHYLIDNGVKTNDKVALFMKRNERLIISLLAILKCRATYIPLDITYPEKRINYILSNSKPKFIISEKELKYDNVIILSSKNLSQISKDFSKNNIKTNDKNKKVNSYIIYTSGSTGNPKGVVITNDNLLNFVLGINKFININSNSKVVSITTISFDIFGLEIWVTLTNGAKLVLANEIQCVNGNELNLLCLNNEVDIIQTTPTKLKLLLTQNNNLFIKQIKKIILGGEAIKESFIRELRDLTDSEIFDAYGPTETTIWSTIKKLEKIRISAGFPISNTYIYILDNKNRILPIGIGGQLAISGNSVSPGYYNNERNTNKSFVYNNLLKKRIYLTGDYSLIDYCGELNIIDRIDLQVKVNGQRVELQEIEKNINEYENINSSIVNLRENKLICFYETKNKKELIDKNSIISFLYNRLPFYMIPKEYYYLERIPMTLNGKIDRKKVNNIDIKYDEVNNHAKPITELQKQIYNIWKKVIKGREFGIDEPFFELGTDSLDAIKVQVELLSIGIHIEYADLFKYPTIIDLEKRIVDQNLITQKEKNKDIKIEVYDDILSTNISSSYVPKKKEIGNILITGVTGFLGAHILDEYMQKGKGNIYCIVRSRNNIDSKTRLKERLKFYFNDKYDNQIGKRIIPIDVDITDFSNLNLALKDIIADISFVVHCAACVKHYGDANYFKKINVDGTETITKICFNNNIKFIHISTLSVSGNAFETASYNKISKDIVFDETCFYKNQNLENIYVYTKFKAEQIVLDYMKKGMQANIMRIGNLTNRYSDLKFQYNEEENAFENRIKTLLNIKMFPKRNIDMYLEFTPVDFAAKAVITIMQFFNTKHNMFHIYNNNHIEMKEFINILKKMNIVIDIVNDNTFSKKIYEISNSKNKEILKGIINDLDKNNTLDYNTNVKIEGKYTIEYLKKIGFSWPIIDNNYIIKYINRINN